MELQQVRYFLALCDERNFSRAAKLCGVRQPSLTNGIKALERDLGGELFVRAAPVQLSELGRQVLPYLKVIKASAQEARRISALHVKRASEARIYKRHRSLGAEAGG